jgi:hypothetical protein
MLIYIAGLLRVAASILAVEPPPESPLNDKINITFSTTDAKQNTTLTSAAEASVSISPDFATFLEYGAQQNFRPIIGAGSQNRYLSI